MIVTQPLANNDTPLLLPPLSPDTLSIHEQRSPGLTSFSPTTFQHIVTLLYPTLPFFSRYFYGLPTLPLYLRLPPHPIGHVPLDTSLPQTLASRNL